jgi:hypothetical protein
MSPIQSTLAAWRTTAGRKNRLSQNQTKNYSRNINHTHNTQQVSSRGNGHRRLIQQSIQGEELNGDKHWGHKLPKKYDDILRIGLRNVNSLPIKKSHCKNTEYINDIQEGNFDCFCGTEVNIAWHNMDQADKVKERFKGCFEFAKHVTSHNNDKDFSEKFQRGGTMITASGPICARIIKSGGDQRTLGRWSWIQIRGNKGISLIIATVYRPVFSTGALSTYQQQKTRLLQENIDQCPRQVLLEDLGQQIETWRNEGFQVMVCGDFNEDVQGAKIRNFFNNFQMSELIISQHGLKCT